MMVTLMRFSLTSSLLLRRFYLLAGLLFFALPCGAWAGPPPLPHSFGFFPVTTTADSGPGSLRAAIEAVGDGDTIYFDPALNGQTIVLTSGELAINASITIAGPGSNLLTVARNGPASPFRIFHVLPGHAVIIEGLTIRGGGDDGGGGAIRNDLSTLSIRNCIIRESGSRWWRWNL